MGRCDPISGLLIWKDLVQRTRDSFAQDRISASVHSCHGDPTLPIRLEFSSRRFGQFAEMQGANLEEVSKSPSRRDVFSGKQGDFFFPPDRGMGNVAASLADRQFPLLTIFLLGHFLVGEMSSHAAA